MQDQESWKTDVARILGNIKPSIETLKKVPDLMESQNKDHVYTDDPEYKELFEDCQKQRRHMSILLTNLKNKVNSKEVPNVEQDIQYLEESINGFYLMISEIEVEQSALNYAKEIKAAFEKLSGRLSQLD